MPRTFCWRCVGGDTQAVGSSINKVQFVWRHVDGDTHSAKKGGENMENTENNCTLLAKCVFCSKEHKTVFRNTFQTVP